MGRVKEFKCGYGVSFEKNGIWYKVNCEQTVEFSESQTKSSIDVEKENNWGQVTAEVENQIDEILKSQEGE